MCSVNIFLTFRTGIWDIFVFNIFSTMLSRDISLDPLFSDHKKETGLGVRQLHRGP